MANNSSHSLRTHGPLEPANEGAAFNADQRRVMVAQDKTTGAPDYFLDDGRPLAPEDAVAIGLGKDKPAHVGYFSGVDFDADGRIMKE